MKKPSSRGACWACIGSVASLGGPAAEARLAQVAQARVLSGKRRP